jgi:hypothetical protein
VAKNEFFCPLIQSQARLLPTNHQQGAWRCVFRIPYSMLTPPRVSNGNDDGRNPTCDPEPKRGWERRYHHVILVVDRNGKLMLVGQELRYAPAKS